VRTEVFHFEDFELDRGACELRRNGRGVPLERIPFDLLCFLVERRGRVATRDEIVERIWGQDVFLEAEHSVNTAIRKVRVALGDDSAAPRFVLTVPGRGYRFVASVREAGTPPAPEPGPAAEQTSKRVMLVVLPFENLSHDPGQEYFSDGLTEETISDLGQLASERLGVIARTSAMTYKGTRKNIAEIGRELGVDYALEGSVRRDGNRVRISAQLIRASDQTHLWAHNYDREIKDVLSVQSDLGRAIAEQVQIRLAPADHLPRAEAGSMDQAAYDAVLHGRFHSWKRTRPNLERAIEYFRQAMTIDPRLAIAHAGVADCYSLLPITSDYRPRDAFPKAEHAAMQALKIDPGLAEAHCALASVRFWYSWDWRACQEHSRRAFARNFNYALAHLFYGHMLSNTGRHDQAIAEIDLARQLDPFSPIINTLCAEFRFHARRYDEVVPLLARTFEIDPHFWVAHVVSAKICQHLEHYDEALEASQKATQFSGGNAEANSLIGFSYARMGRRSEAERVLQELQSLSMQAFVPPYNLATIYLGLGDTEKTLECLEKAYQERDVHMVFLGVEPKWDLLRDDPRFQSLIRRLALA
jgi:TolB-like protein